MKLSICSECDEVVEIDDESTPYVIVDEDSGETMHAQCYTRTRARERAQETVKSQGSERIADFIETVRGQAEWRSRISLEYPDDERNGRAAEGLSDLEEWLKSKPADNVLIERLDKALEKDTGQMVPSVSEMLGRF